MKSLLKINRKKNEPVQVAQNADNLFDLENEN